MSFSTWNKSGLALVLVTLILLTFTAAADAATFRAGDSETIASGTTINDDLYISGGNVQIDGTVSGDVVAAGGTIIINGKVEGDLIAAGGQITVEGDIRNTVRMAGGNLTFAGSAGRDLVVAGGTLQVPASGRIGQDLVVGGGDVNLFGNVGRNINAGAGNMQINGRVGQDVRIDTENLEVGPEANIGGDVRYRSAAKADISESAQISGEVVQSKPPAKKQTEKADFSIVGFILSYLWLLTLGTVLIALLPRYARTVNETTAGDPWKSLLVGFLAVIAVPIAVIMALITVIGIPLALITLALYFIAIYLTKVFVSYFVGDFILGHLMKRPPHWFLALAIGLLIVLILAAIPVLGFFVKAAVVFFGLGAMLLSLFGIWRRGRSTEPAAATTPTHAGPATTTGTDTPA